MFGPANAAELRAAQILAGATMALFLSVGLIPGMQPHAWRIRVGVLVAYLLGAAVFVVYALWH